MSGIAGIAHRQGAGAVRREAVERMCASLRHRGPDHCGIHIADGIGLGVQRLAVIDPGGNHQLVFNEDGTKVIVFNGEIYNYRDLRRELTARGHVFHTGEDAETILHLYEDGGPECVNRLQGMFAFAIWDANARTLFLARDRFGMKPLYLVRAPWGLAFASELKALHAAGMDPGMLDLDALDTYVQLGYIPAPATPFRGVKKLEPGHSALWRESGEVTVRRYWDLPEDTDDTPPDPEVRVLEWLDEAVASHLASDVPVAVLLCGGLDSSAVLSSMAGSGPVSEAFAAHGGGDHGEDLDEVQLNARVTDRYGIRLTVVDTDDDVSRFEDIVYALDEPHADESAVPTWALAQAVSGKYKVAMTGVGGDELFAGRWRHIGILMSEAYRQPRGVQLRAEPVDGRRGRGNAHGPTRWKRFLRTGDAGFPDRFLSYVTSCAGTERESLYTTSMAQDLGGDGAQSRLRNLFLRGGCRGGLAGGLYLDYKTSLPDGILAMTDRIAMAHSLEIRAPMADHRLVERVFRLPDRVKVRSYVKKLLLRRALRSRLPREHLRTPTRGLTGPTGAWLRNVLRPMLEDELSAARMDRLGYFNPGAVQRLLHEHVERRHDHARILWTLLCFSTWHRLFVESPAPPLYQPEGRSRLTVPRGTANARRTAA